jgi:hypothetical protein
MHPAADMIHGQSGHVRTCQPAKTLTSPEKSLFRAGFPEKRLRSATGNTDECQTQILDRPTTAIE